LNPARRKNSVRANDSKDLNRAIQQIKFATTLSSAMLPPLFKGKSLKAGFTLAKDKRPELLPAWVVRPQ
jgi:hypothetical protein